MVHHFNKLYGNTIKCKLCTYMIGVRRFSRLLCHYELRHPEDFRKMGSLEKLREVYGICFKGRVGYTVSYKDEPTPSTSRAPSPLPGINLDRVRDVNTEAFSKEVYGGYDDWMLQEDIELGEDETGIERVDI